MIRSRPYSPDDLGRIVALAGDAWLGYGPQTFFHVGDVYWRLRQPGWVDRLRLWEDDSSRLLAFASFDPPDDFEFQVHPEYWGRDLEARILDWGEQRAAEAAQAEGRSSLPATWASELDAGLMCLLESRGYARTEECCAHLRRPLDTPIDLPRVPPGYVLRSIQGEADVDARVAVHREVFAPSAMTREVYEMVMCAPGYRRDLDVVAAAPDGSFAGFCLCWLDERSRTGELEPVGTHPGHRRLGLAAAAVLEGLRRLRDAGAARALVMTAGNNTAALRLYESCGFQVDRLDYRYVQNRTP